MDITEPTGESNTAKHAADKQRTWNSNAQNQVDNAQNQDSTKLSSRSDLDNRTASKDTPLHGTLMYTETENRTILRDSKNSIARWANDIITFIQKKIKTRGDFERLYCGKLTEKLTARVFKDTGFDFSGASFIITSYFEDSHSIPSVERSRGQVAITPKLLASLPNELENYQNVKYDGKTKDGRYAFVFEIEIDGTKRAVLYFSKGRNSLTLQTVYGWNQKKNLSETSDIKIPDRTSKNDHSFDSSNVILYDSSAGGNTFGEISLEKK